MTLSIWARWVFDVDQACLGCGLLQEGGDADLRGVEGVFVAIGFALEMLGAGQGGCDFGFRLQSEAAAVGELAAEADEVAIVGNTTLIDQHDSARQLL